MVLPPAQTNYFIATQTVRDAIYEDNEGDIKISYCKYLSSILFMVQSLKDDAWNKKDMQSLCNDTSKLLILTQNCLGRVIDIFDEQTQKKNEKEISNLNDRACETVADCRADAPTPTTPLVSTNSTKARELLWSSLPTPPGYSSSLSSQNNPNHSMFQAYQRRKTLSGKNTKQKSDAMSYNLSLFRQAAEKMAISQAKEKAFKEKIADQVIRLKAEAERRCSKLQMRSKTDSEFRQNLLTEILAFEHEAQWPMKYRDAFILNKDDHISIGKVLKALLLRKDHPIGKALVKLQTSIYNQIYQFVIEDTFVEEKFQPDTFNQNSDFQASQAKSQSFIFSDENHTSRSNVQEATTASENLTPATCHLSQKYPSNSHFVKNDQMSFVEQEFEELENSMFSDSDDELTDDYSALSINELHQNEVEDSVQNFDLINSKIKINENIYLPPQENIYSSPENQKEINKDLDSNDMERNSDNQFYGFDHENSCKLTSSKVNDENNKYESILHKRANNIYEVLENDQKENIYEELPSVKNNSNDFTYQPLNPSVIENQSHIYETISANLDLNESNDSNKAECNDINQNEEDEFSVGDDIAKRFSHIIQDILFTIDRLYTVCLLAYETLDTPLGRDQVYATLESVLFEPLWQWVIKLFRKVDLKKILKLEYIMKTKSEYKPEDMMIREKFALSDSLNPPYQEAINEIQLLVGMTSPLEKLECAVRTMKCVCTCVEIFYSNKGTTPPLVGCDDLLPIVSYIILKSGLPQIVSECHAMLEFIHEGYLMGEEGYCLTTLQTGISSLLALN